METFYEIIPGESIGPFRLRMTRKDIAELSIRPMEMFKDNSGAEFPSVGVAVYYDGSGRCKRIEARVFGPDKGRPRFALAGHSMNNVSEGDARAIFSVISSDLRHFYGGFSLPSAGLKAVKWENSDDFIFAVVVERPQKR